MRPFELSSPVLEMGSASTAQAWSCTEGPQHLGHSLPAVLDARCLLTAVGPGLQGCAHRTCTWQPHGCFLCPSPGLPGSQVIPGAHTLAPDQRPASLPPPGNPQRIAGAEQTLLRRLKGSSAGELDKLY